MYSKRHSDPSANCLSCSRFEGLGRHFFSPRGFEGSMGSFLGLFLQGDKSRPSPLKVVKVGLHSHLCGCIQDFSQGRGHPPPSLGGGRFSCPDWSCKQPEAGTPQRSLRNAPSAAGIAYIHGCSIVHRDLKPANILVDTHGICKVCPEPEKQGWGKT